MAERVETNTRAIGAKSSVGELIGRGIHAEIWLDDDGTTVRKRYRSENGVTADAMAAMEYRALRRVSTLLRDIPGVSSPMPRTVDATAGELVMEFRAGVPLHQAITCAPGDLAERLARAMIALSESIALEQIDISVRNTLFEPDTNELVFLDFTMRPLSVSKPANAHPIEYMLAGFLASALTFHLHASDILRCREAIQLTQFSEDLVGELSALTAICRRTVTDLTWEFFRYRTQTAGLKRRIWFSTVGAMAFRAWLKRVMKRCGDERQVR